jgi:CRISPR-associated exonuclease Cas4
MDDDTIPISALNHYLYCPRRCALIHMEKTFAENVHTLRGNALHEHADEVESSQEAGVRIERALPLFSDCLRLVGKADVVEFHSGDVPYPVEYKQGKKKQWDNDDIQLAAQAMCLEEMTSSKVTHGAIYHHTSRRRREVEITDELRRKVEETVAAVRTLLKSGILPPPVNDERCRHCSLNEICQPQALGQVSKLHVLRTHLYEPDDG